MNEASFLRMIKGAAAAALVALSLSGCAAPGSEAPEANDPFEGVNRVVFGVNEAADYLFIGPVSDTYRRIVPDPIQDVVQSFTRNLWMPITIANNLLQGDFDGVIQSTGRFLTNTILGGGGIADVATAAGNPYRPEDFGQTLAVWGFGDGPYIVLPLLGPSNLRDAVGYAADTVADPVRLWGNATYHRTEVNGARVGYVVDKRGRAVDAIEDLRKNSVDYYAVRRSLYAQMRKNEIENKPATGTTQADFPVFDQTPPKK